MKRTFGLLAMMASLLSIGTSHGKDRSQSALKSKQLEYIHSYIEDAAAKYRLEPALLRAVVQVESNFNHKAVSRVGAKGLMQLMPKTAKALSSERALDHRHPSYNVNTGAKYLRDLINEFEGNLPLALAAYNAGPGAVKKYGGVPPYKETKEYVKKVLARLEQERIKFYSSSDL